MDSDVKRRDSDRKMKACCILGHHTKHHPYHTVLVNVIALLTTPEWPSNGAHPFTPLPQSPPPPPPSSPPPP